MSQQILLDLLSRHRKTICVTYSSSQGVTYELKYPACSTVQLRRPPCGLCDNGDLRVVQHMHCLPRDGGSLVEVNIVSAGVSAPGCVLDSVSLGSRSRPSTVFEWSAVGGYNQRARVVLAAASAAASALSAGASAAQSSGHASGLAGFQDAKEDRGCCPAAAGVVGARCWPAHSSARTFV